MKKTVTVIAPTGVVGSSCVNELIKQDHFNTQVLVRRNSAVEKSSFRPLHSSSVKQHMIEDWQSKGVTIKEADASDSHDLIQSLSGTDIVISCVPFTATNSQYAYIYAAKEAGVERFVPSEFGYIYEWEQFWPTDTAHKAMAKEKVFIRRMIEMSGMDFTIIPCGLFPEYFMIEPIQIIGDGNQKFSWSTGSDAGRIIPHVLAHPLSKNAVCPVAATAYLSWHELLAERSKVLGRPIERNYPNEQNWREIYQQAEQQKDGVMMTMGAIALASLECPEGMPLWANWNNKHLPDFQGTPMKTLFEDIIEPFVKAATEAASNI